MVSFLLGVEIHGRSCKERGGAQGPGFQDALVQALQSTSSLQKESGRLSKAFQLENSTARLKETLLAGANQQEL